MNVYLNDIDNGEKLFTGYNKKQAQQIKKQYGGVIRFMSYSQYKDSHCPGDYFSGWDYPTFRLLSEVLK